jgi:8-hydroxy-5-deazaflavin:NADPH oxidoreductase
MKIAVLGTGMVGNTIASKLVSLGHEVKMGSRTATNEKAAEWVKQTGKGASQGTFAEAAEFGEIAFHATSGGGAIDVVRSARDGLKGKILVDISNPLDFSKGFPPSLSVSNTDSLGEQIQRELPDTKVVKTLNTVNCFLMVDAGKVNGGDHDMFICGNDEGAKGHVSEILKGWFGWKNLVDLGDITNARATEGYLPMWVRLYGALKTADFNIKIVR